jgi:multidrug efflux pump subunit AcrA (membrane-fusion protein)
MPNLSSWFARPKIVISVAAIIAAFIGVLAYPHVGVAPKVDLGATNEASTTIVASGSTVDLAFPKSGRVATVSVKNGDEVHQGQVLTTLSAPDALGLVSQAKGALDLAIAQYASLDLNYANTKKQQDTIVANAYQTLLKTAPEAVARNVSGDDFTARYPLPTISGNYSLGKEGTITLKTYAAQAGLAYRASGLISEEKIVTENPRPLGNSGLSIAFPAGLDPNLTWTITIPNTRSATYATNKEAYDLAVINREKILTELAANLNSSSGSSVARAQISAARGAYEAALGAYQSNVITAPVSGRISFVDENLKAGQSVTAGKRVISITAK